MPIETAAQPSTGLKSPPNDSRFAGPDDLVIPAAALASHEGFRRWARSDAFPERGRIDYLDGQVVIDMSPSRRFGHGRPIAEFSRVLTQLVHESGEGELFLGQTLVSHAGSGLSAEPDFVYVRDEAFETARVRPVRSADDDSVELEGSPDLVVEVVSPSSVTTDKRVLRETYFAAGIAEYWLVDVRGERCEYVIHVREDGGFMPVGIDDDGMQRSPVLGRRFRLVRGRHRLEGPKFTLEVAE